MVEHDGCLRGFECHRYLILGRGPGPTLNFTSRNAGSGPPHGFTAAVTSWGFRLCSNQPSASHTCPLLGQAETDIPPADSFKMWCAVPGRILYLSPTSS